MTLLTERPAAPPDAPHRRVYVFPVLVVAVLVAILTVIGGLLHWGSLASTTLVIVAVAATCWGAWLAVRRPSLVIAPLAICILALGNPLTLAGATINVQEHAGVVTLRTDGGFGLVLWKQYPSIAGWSAPADPQPVNTVAYATRVQAAVRSIVNVMTQRETMTWSVTPNRPSGVTGIPNGFGGPSMFDRVDSAQWVTTLDGSAAQHQRLIVAARGAAAQLALDQETVAAGEPLTGDGTLTWSATDGVLTLVIEADAVTVWFEGGPLLSSTALPGEFGQRMADFAGLTPPPPLVQPVIPIR